MTLVVLAVGRNSVTGISDFMLSDENLWEGVINTPSVFVDGNRKRGSIYDAKLGQKFGFFGSSGILGWSGDYAPARSIYAAFEELGPLSGQTDAEIDAHFRSLLAPRERSIAALLAVNRHPQGGRLWGGGTTTRQTINDLEFSVIGSGTIDFLNFLHRMADHNPRAVTEQHVKGLFVGFCADAMMGQRLGDFWN